MSAKKQWTMITEPEFAARIADVLSGRMGWHSCVTGPGRSGALAAVYASHILSIPFIPFGAKGDRYSERMLIIDTTTETGETLRKARKEYPHAQLLAIYRSPPRVMFWYEAPKPQRYLHEHGTGNWPVAPAIGNKEATDELAEALRVGSKLPALFRRD